MSYNSCTSYHRPRPVIVSNELTCSLVHVYNFSIAPFSVLISQTVLRVLRSRPRDSNTSYVPTHRRASTLARDIARSATLHGCPHVTTQKTSIYYLSNHFSSRRRTYPRIPRTSFVSAGSTARHPALVVWTQSFVYRCECPVQHFARRTHRAYTVLSAPVLRSHGPGGSEIKALHRSRPLSVIEPRIRCSRLHLSGASVYPD
ncbi:hypothetical protein K438DRAFT_845416 [Mycena galopus ATCC 62051]|nr:hypothetical protein K438DRAFT_845416 [Mycena galopus ATCC 62051]